MLLNEHLINVVRKQMMSDILLVNIEHVFVMITVKAHVKPRVIIIINNFIHYLLEFMHY